MTASLAAEGQAPDQQDSGRRPGWEWVAGWGAALALAGWMSQLSYVWLAAVGLGALVWTAHSLRRRRGYRLAAALVLWAAVALAGLAQHRLDRILHQWDELQLLVEEDAGSALQVELDDMITRGERAVAGAVDAVAVSGEGADAALFNRLEEVRRDNEISAVALYAADGSPIAWAGEHRGEVPGAARMGRRAYIFHDGPLFGYLYLSRRLESGNAVVAAFMLESAVEVAEGNLPLVERFARQFGARPRFCPEESPCLDFDWDYETRDQRIMSVSFSGVSQQNWWDREALSARRSVGALGLLLLALLTVAWYRSRLAPSGLSVGLGTLALLIAPLGSLGVAGWLFSPLRFSLPGPWSITLGTLLIAVGGASLGLLTRAGGQPRRPLPPLLAALLLGLISPLVLGLIGASASSALLATAPTGGFTLSLVAALLIALPTYLILRRTRPFDSSPGVALALRVVGYVLPGFFAVAVLLWWRPGLDLPPLVFGIWGVPAVLLVALEDPDRWWRGAVRVWLVSAWLAGTAILAFLWPLHVQDDLASAEAEIRQLGVGESPQLAERLAEFARLAIDLDTRGEQGVNLLYHSWVDSGLAEQGYDANIALWRDGSLETELNLSEPDSLPQSVVAEMTASLAQPVIRYFGGREGLHYLAMVPLPDGRTISVAVPPRRGIAAATPLARLLQPGGSLETAPRSRQLFLVPSDAGTIAEDHLMVPRIDMIQWMRTDGWWRSESLVEMPERLVHAHLDIALPATPLLLARMILVQAAILLSALAIWLVARVLCRELNSVPFLRADWIRSFRGRLSVSLFVFFLLPTLAFGAISYGAVAREVVQSAAALAQQALDEAAARFPAVSFPQLGAAAGSELLLYRQGTLSGATAPEILDLGLFHTWLTPTVYLPLAGGRDLVALEERSLSRSDYLVAYRRLDLQNVLAAPIPLASQEITRRQQEFRDVALVVILLGLGLSVVLALLVSRALTRPLDELSRAALTVGEGNLTMRLTEQRKDEFGSLYTTFNRMVGRLNRTRAALEQETRRTETIVAEAAAGVLALDARGRVELINPRAAEIIGLPIATGDPLLEARLGDGALVAALSELWGSRSPEAATELELEGRVVRLRLRRLSGEEGGGGAVVAVEDLTAEVRTARVLAWGEMARQVAHEIKNPLTPIKLAIQHVRRAYGDKRADFEDILDRNVEAILREIDRLGEIARAFSRFGTPGAGMTPLEAVDVTQAVRETLALYGGGGDLVFQADLPSDLLPAVVGRPTELKEVLVNLLENARDAIDGAGTITIALRQSADPDHVSLRVVDSGVGIPPGQIDRIFEPHFSTRSSGTGLGLAIVKRIVDSWGAEIRVESSPGQGTVVELSLRAADTTLPAVES